jgi:2-haloacid dehalogenase
MAINTIIFDLGGVLIDWDPRHVYRTIFKSEEEIERFLTHVCTPAWNAEQDRGRSLREATEELAATHPEYADEIRAFYGRWPEMLGGAISESVELLDSLRQSGQYRLLALTNWSAETFSIARNRFDFLTWFEGIVVSGEEQIIKPDLRLYQVLLDRYQVDPAQAVFIDDAEKNVVAARQVGLHGIHFRSPMQLREDLADLL